MPNQGHRYELHEHQKVTEIFTNHIGIWVPLMIMIMLMFILRYRVAADKRIERSNNCAELGIAGCCCLCFLQQAGNEYEVDFANCCDTLDEL